MEKISFQAIYECEIVWRQMEAEVIQDEEERVKEVRYHVTTVAV